MTPRVLLLDVMDTVVWDPYRLMPDFFGQTWVELVSGRNRTGWKEFERGIIDEETFLRTFFEDERDFDRAAFVAMFRDGYRFLDGMEALLGELAGRGVAMHALSNYPSWFTMIEDKLALSRFLPWTFVSWNTGVRKPAPGAYTGGAESLGLLPGECLFVDDRERNCEGARAVGMPAVRFESAGQLRRELVACGLLPG